MQSSDRFPECWDSDSAVSGHLHLVLKHLGRGSSKWTFGAWGRPPAWIQKENKDRGKSFHQALDP